tara:strand:- start:396 stop:749 length:354 start_codon:yes stop_codon:yes gene_type:complete
MSLETVGRIKEIKETHVISDSFSKREFIITDESSQYPQIIMFQCTQDRCDLLNAFSVGQEIKILFNLRGREWESPTTGEIKVFNTLEAWRIEAKASAPQQQAPAPQIETGNADDLPF